MASSKLSHLDRVHKAHVAIMKHKTWCAFGGVLACGKTDVTDKFPTAYSDGWNTRYGTKFVDLLDDSELRFVVLHENMHKAYRHCNREHDLRKESAELLNIAMDAFINISLKDTDAGENFITFPKIGGVPPMEKYRGWSVRQIYADMKQQAQSQGGGKGKKGDGDPSNMKGFDEHDFEEGDEEGEGQGNDAEAQEAQRAEEIQRAMRQGEQIRRKMQGKGAGDRDGVFGDLLQIKVDWRKLLREFVTETCQGRDESSWRKPNRRYLSQDVYMPSMYGITMNELVIGFDTSGSCFGGHEMMLFVSHIERIISDVKPSKVHVIYWDTQVAGHQIFEEGQFAVQQMQPKGGGGTDGAVLFDYLRDKRIDPQAIIQFTDGYVGSWGNSTWPTLWACTTDQTAPYGTTIRIED